MFDSVSRKTRARTLLKGTLAVLLVAYLSIGLMAAYRAWFQVKSLDLKTDSSILKPGSAIQTTLVSYARTTIDVRVELIQEAHAETIATIHLRGNEWAFFDPRSRQASQSTVVNADLLSRFDRGTAKLRATAVGREQWTRLPPPVVRELTLEIPGN
jgi:hypothetical protein